MFNTRCMKVRGSATMLRLLRASRLARWRLASSLQCRVARVLAGISAIAFVIAVVILRAKGAAEGLPGLVERSALVAAWIATPFVAMWSARNRADLDRRDGIAELARIRGIDEPLLALGRGITATTYLARLVFLATLPSVVAAAACSPSLRGAVGIAASTIPLAAFSLAVGLAGGALPAACGHVAPHRGRSLFLAIVFLPWMLDGLIATGRTHAGSVPGVLSMIARLVGATGDWG